VIFVVVFFRAWILMGEISKNVKNIEVVMR